MTGRKNYDTELVCLYRSRKVVGAVAFITRRGGKARQEESESSKTPTLAVTVCLPKIKGNDSSNHFSNSD